MSAIIEDVAPGTYRWVARLTLGGVVYDADAGSLVVMPNLAVEAASDQRSHAERMLAAVEAELQARIDGTGSAHDAYAIGGRSIQKLKVPELMALRAKYSSEVARERNGGRLPPVVVRFGSV